MARGKDTIVKIKRRRLHNAAHLNTTYCTIFRFCEILIAKDVKTLLPNGDNTFSINYTREMEKERTCLRIHTIYGPRKVIWRMSFARERARVVHTGDGRIFRKRIPSRLG